VIGLVKTVRPASPEHLIASSECLSFSRGLRRHRGHLRTAAFLIKREKWRLSLQSLTGKFIHFYEVDRRKPMNESTKDH
jgi:hypothetical protein